MSTLYIDQFKEDNGLYRAPDGLQYEEPIDVIASAIFDFCACGEPEEALSYIHGAMKLIYARKEADYSNESHAALLSYFHSEGERFAMYYLLDSKGLTEHGTVVPGWLTEMGIGIMNDLKILLAAEGNLSGER